MSANPNLWNHAEEREISLGSLLWKIIYSWRLVVISTIFCAILVTGVKYIEDVRTIHATEAQAEDAVSNLTKKESAQVSIAKLLTTQLAEKKDYQSNSILMGLNPYQKNVVTLQYYVNTGYTFNLDSDVQRDDTSNLVNSYVAYIDDNGLLDSVCNSLDWKNKDVYIGELITASGKVSSSDNVTDQAATFCVYLAGKNVDAANKLADAVEKAINDYQPVLAEKIGSHQLTLLDRYVSMKSDTKLADNQNILTTTIVSLQTQLTTTTATFTPAQLQMLSGEMASNDDSATAVSVKAVVSKKYVLFGAFVGLFISCMWLILCHFMNNRIKTVQELQREYGLRVVGNLTVEGKEKRFFAGVDKWLESLQGKDRLTLDEQKNLILTNLKMTCKKENTQHLFLTTSVHLSNQDENTIHMLIESLQLVGLKAELGSDIMRNAESFEKMSEIGKVILIEKLNETRYDSLEQELVLCQEQESQVIGVVVIA